MGRLWVGRLLVCGCGCLDVLRVVCGLQWLWVGDVVLLFGCCGFSLLLLWVRFWLRLGVGDGSICCGFAPSWFLCFLGFWVCSFLRFGVLVVVAYLVLCDEFWLVVFAAWLDCTLRFMLVLVLDFVGLVLIVTSWWCCCGLLVGWLL